VKDLNSNPTIFIWYKNTR